MRLNGGPLAHRSAEPPQPLSLDEEAALAFAACGVTGHALAELPYRSGEEPEAGSGNIMTHFVARTVASGDAIHAVVLFVLDDDGVWMLRRPQDYPRAEVAELTDAARRHEWTELYRRARVRIGDDRADVPREIPFVPAFNKWSANRPGTTYFLPVNELSALYINMMLTGFGEEFAYFVVDERNRYKPAGLARFARSRGGHLHDDPGDGRLMTVGLLENWLYEFAAIEQGGMLQNLALMTQALGLGGFPHFAAHPYAWFDALGFRMEPVPLTRLMGAGPILRWILRLLGREMPVPTAVGLEREEDVLLRPFCPPWYRDMEEAVLAFVEYKQGEGTGTHRDGGTATAWKDGARVQAGIPAYSDRAIAATIAHCEYVYRRYGRFPASSGPFRTILAHQAHHLDPAFYEEYYREDALSESQREHDGRWHRG
ncbi:MAG TPA: hypothetical protein VLL48_00035 [Longimicrobiales bacterium]|nr:hypothetical protein [Longimicrobiales bacterium]